MKTNGPCLSFWTLIDISFTRRWIRWQYLFQDESERLTVCKKKKKTSYWIHDTARNSCAKGQPGEAIGSRRFFTGRLDWRQLLGFQRHHYGSDGGEKKKRSFLFFFFPESGRPWQSGDNEAKWQRGEEKVWCVTRIPERTWIWSSR